MKLTKDEARILAAALEEYKYEIVNKFYDLKLMPKLDQLQERLEKSGKDERRTGRTSLDDFHDCLKRFGSN
jgi:hypothetical protein